jgi:hypothetical protein
MHYDQDTVDPERMILQRLYNPFTPRLLAVPGVIALGLALAWLPARGQAAPVGPVTGVIDGVRFEGDQYYVSGWACQ